MAREADIAKLKDYIACRGLVDDYSAWLMFGDNDDDYDNIEPA